MHPRRSVLCAKMPGVVARGQGSPACQEAEGSGLGLDKLSVAQGARGSGFLGLFWKEQGGFCFQENHSRITPICTPTQTPALEACAL